MSENKIDIKISLTPDQIKYLNEYLIPGNKAMCEALIEVLENAQQQLTDKGQNCSCAISSGYIEEKYCRKCGKPAKKLNFGRLS